MRCTKSCAPKAVRALAPPRARFPDRGDVNSIRISAIRPRAWREPMPSTLASPLDSSPFPQQSLAAVRGEAYSRHGTRYCCWRCSGCCCCAASHGSCWSCCSKRSRATNGSRSFSEQSRGQDTPNFDIRHRTRGACALNQMFRIAELLEEFAAATNVFRHVFPVSVSSQCFQPQFQAERSSPDNRPSN